MSFKTNNPDQDQDQATTTLSHVDTTMSQFTMTTTDHGSALVEHVQHQPFENGHNEFPNEFPTDEAAMPAEKVPETKASESIDNVSGGSGSNKIQATSAVPFDLPGLLLRKGAFSASYIVPSLVQMLSIECMSPLMTTCREITYNEEVVLYRAPKVWVDHDQARKMVGAMMEKQQYQTPSATAAHPQQHNFRRCKNHHAGRCGFVPLRWKK